MRKNQKKILIIKLFSLLDIKVYDYFYGQLYRKHL